MKRVLVSDEKPVAMFTGVFSEYTREGIAVDCGHIILSRKGTATLRINFQQVEQKKDNVVILFPGDVVMVEQANDDFELEYLVFTESIGRDVFTQLEDVSLKSIEKVRSINSYELAQITNSMFSILSQALHIGTPKESHFISLMQLRSFFTVYQAYLVSKGFDIGTFRKRKDELFARFLRLLSKHFSESRTVSFYAEKLSITTKYLTEIAFSHTGTSAKSVIDEYTIMQIRLILQHSDKPISEIAWELKFSSLAFFSDYFKRHTGETPQVYRSRF